MKNSIITTLKKIPKEKKNKLIADLVNKHAKVEQIKLANGELLKEIEKIKEEFNQASKETMQNLLQAKEIFIENLIEKSKSKSLTKWQKDIISDILHGEFDDLQQLNCITPNIQKLMAEYQKSIYSSMSKTEKMMADAMMESMKTEMDLPDDFNFTKMHDEEYLKNMHQKMHKKNFEKEKQAKQKETFENQKNINIDFKQLYRKLARFSHPDLAKTQQEKEEKEKNIKKINAAWETLDYYELILIWMEIDPENELDIELSEKNCKEIIQHLNDKILDLEYEKYIITNENPNTAFYYQKFYAKQSKIIHKKIDKFVTQLEESIHDTNLRIQDIKTLASLKRILAIIYDQDQERFDLFDEEIIERIFRKM